MGTACNVRCVREAILCTLTALGGFVPVLLLAGCLSTVDPGDDEALPALHTLMDAPASTPQPALAPSPAAYRQVELGPDQGTGFVNGWLTAAGAYDLYALGPGRVGDRWRIGQLWPPFDSGVVLALFDEDLCLLARAGSPSSDPLDHVLRRDAASVFLGVTTACDAPGGAYWLQIRRSAGADVPPPRRQIVWLNFAGATDVSIGRYRHLSFGPFRGAMLGADSAGATAELKQVITDTLRGNYADYDVTVLTSDQVRQPAEPHAVIHFGGHSDTQLGVAADVDEYNAWPAQTAVVFVESFGQYATMPLTAGELGTMIGNVASHELGHLLGLYHVRQPDQIMAAAETCSAADMARRQSFGLADLGACVFPVGQLNADMLLQDAVGLRPQQSRQRGPG